MPQQPSAPITSEESPKSSATQRAFDHFLFWLCLILGLVFLGFTSCQPRITPLPSDSPERVSQHKATVVLTPRIRHGGRAYPVATPLLDLRLRYETAGGKAVGLEVKLPAHFHGQPELALQKPLLLVMEERDGRLIPHEIRNPAGGLLAGTADLRAPIIQDNAAREHVRQRDAESGLVLGLGCFVLAGIMRFRSRQARRAIARD
ncbi:MAG: hypothetical protein Q4D19_08585 [Lautropia sp.]|nr:hypothetical protein [Lautropia sp.]